MSFSVDRVFRLIMADVDAKDIGLIDTPDAIKDKRTQVHVLHTFEDFHIN